MLWTSHDAWRRNWPPRSRRRGPRGRTCALDIAANQNRAGHHSLYVNSIKFFVLQFTIFECAVLYIIWLDSTCLNRFSLPNLNFSKHLKTNLLWASSNMVVSAFNQIDSVTLSIQPCLGLSMAKFKARSSTSRNTPLRSSNLLQAKMANIIPTYVQSFLRLEITKFILLP